MRTSIFTTLLFTLLMISCTSPSYKMSTAVNRDGTVSREINAPADSSFLAGDASANPFLFEVDKRWEIVVSDSVTKGIYQGGRPYITIKRTADAIGDLSDGLKYERYKRALADPRESLQRRFRWFYTYYDFTAVYPEIEDKGDVPLHDYFSPEELALWLSGDMSAYPGFNGVELKSVLDDLEEKFLKWYNRSLYEAYFDIIVNFAGADTPFASSLMAAKATVFDKNRESIEPFDFSPEMLCGMLDKYYDTEYFSTLYGDKEEGILSEAERRTAIIELFGTEISCGLVMPGRVVSANAAVRDGRELIWKVDAWRVLGADYRLAATSRTPNYWAWALTLLIILSFVSFFIVARRRRN